MEEQREARNTSRRRSLPLSLLPDSLLPGFAYSRFTRKPNAYCCVFRSVIKRRGRTAPWGTPWAGRRWPRSPGGRTARPAFPQACRRRPAPRPGATTAGSAEVPAVSSSPRTQHLRPHWRTVLSAAPSNWLYSAPCVRASSGRAWCWKTWPILRTKAPLGKS